MTKQDKYVARMKLQLDELNTKMSELEAAAQDARSDARETYERAMSRLRDDSRAAVAKLDEVRASSEDSWHKMVSEMEKMREAFQQSFKHFRSPA